MQRHLTKDRQIDLSKSNTPSTSMISTKFIIICGLLLAIIGLYANVLLAVGAVAVSILNLSAKPTNKTYVVSISLLFIIAMRAAWIMQGAS